MISTLFIVWQADKHDIGIPIVDEQHRGLVSLINTFYFHKRDAANNIDKFLAPAADMLISYTGLYFLTLERLMEESGYPKIAEEIEKNKEMMTLVRNTEMECRNTRDADKFLTFLKSYWIDYVQRMDSEEILYLKKHFGNT